MDFVGIFICLFLYYFNTPYLTPGCLHLHLCYYGLEAVGTRLVFIKEIPLNLKLLKINPIADKECVKHRPLVSIS